MAPKRPIAADEISGREKKKLKVSFARTIAVQPIFETGPSKANAVNKPKSNSLQGLPSTIDVEKFVEVRSFEIDAMHDAMKTASASSTHRVWQTLPRHLRRRAASHDVRRVPLKLRERAAAEMDPARNKPPKKTKPKHGRAKQVSRTDSFLKRQVNKAWLETHIWHAKRMHMKDMWGYRLSVSPTEKSYRPSHRASLHDAILHDASYYSFFEISGSEKILVPVLESICDPQGPGPGSKRYLGGTRALETHMYKRNMYPYDLITPLTVIWRPQSISSLPPNDRKGKGKETMDFAPTLSNSSSIRTVWLKFHPSAEPAVLDALKEAASWTLAQHRKILENSSDVSFEIVNLQAQFNVFEIMGPKSSQVLRGSLSPVNSDIREDFSQFWSSLINLQSAGSIPRGMIIGFKVIDPRLNFPPKIAKPRTDNSGRLHVPPITLPSSQLAESEIWDADIRSGLAKPIFKKKDLDERRSKNAVPGTSLHATRQDDRVPVLLIQRSLENINSTDSQPVHGWNLIVPAGWGMPFFSSLTFTDTRVSGQFERQTQSYESGVAYFPRDYPSTKPYELYASERAIEEKTTWDRKPPAKRVNYGKLGTRNPWKVDWTTIVGAHTAFDKTSGADSELSTTQREPLAAPEANKKVIRPWLLRGSEVPKILSNISSMLNHSAALLSEVNRLRLKRGLAVVASNVNTDELFQGALVNVKLTMCLRGAPQDLAMIYSLSDSACRQWKKLIHKAQSSSIDEEMFGEEELANIVPSEAAIVGYVTTGHYSLSRGHGFAIGAISLVHLLALEQQSIRLHPNQQAPSKARPMFVGLRNIDGHQCRMAILEVLVEC
ncbi:hypothetical protein HYPSUDRAFT_67916 [Hypholoma sublateritium FD-334 SS-4]|uniref:POP1-domain-containing protein n=1 Tax=Hypholoma sublateritium (strain FD-334 SS-4) TaxID=945553 RepID=A0A0D2PMW4_HYPSF|nr:hypothetical protein HYPSUDRAFT_67916 [Hypholoma sublateritium FD-334 SS-4]